MSDRGVGGGRGKHRKKKCLQKKVINLINQEFRQSLSRHGQSLRHQVRTTELTKLIQRLLRPRCTIYRLHSQKYVTFSRKRSVYNMEIRKILI